MSDTQDDVATFLDAVKARLEHGARDYGDQSFLRPVQATVAAMLDEQLDLVGWCYVLWCQASRKTDTTRRQDDLRHTFLQAVEHRIRRNDRRAAYDHATGPASCMAELEVLAIDLYLAHVSLRLRVLPIARAIEVAQYLPPFVPRGRRGSVHDSRSSD